MKIYDVDLIMSWTPNEYKAFKKGALLQDVDDLENMARIAVFHRIATNKKKLNIEKDLFDARSARKRIIDGDNAWKESKKIDTTRHAKAQEAMKRWAENFNKKG